MGRVWRSEQPPPKHGITKEGKNNTKPLGRMFPTKSTKGQKRLCLSRRGTKKRRGVYPSLQGAFEYGKGTSGQGFPGGTAPYMPIRGVNLHNLKRERTRDLKSAGAQHPEG